MRIVAMVTAWRRPEVTRCCYRALSRVQVPPGWSFDVQIAGSEGEASRSMAEEFGFRYVETPNRPLSRKHNLMLRATRELDWDYVWLLGSDTLVTSRIMDMYRPTLEAGAAWCGLRDLYFYDAATARLLYWPGYDKAVTGDVRRVRPDTIGAGRMFSRETVERTGWTLWSRHKNRGLDWDCFLRLSALEIGDVHLRHWAEDQTSPPSPHRLLELRTDVQVTQLEHFRRLAPVDAPAELAELLAGSPYQPC